MENITITIDNDPFVSVKELNDVLKKSLPENFKVTIEFVNVVRNIDIVFFAGLFLLYQQNKNSFIISHTNFKLEHSGFEISHYFAHLMSLYDLKDINDVIRIKGISPTHRDQIVSSSFAPIIYVNSTTLHNIFTNIDNNNMFAIWKGNYWQHMLNNTNNLKEAAFLKSPEMIQRYKEMSPLHMFIFKIVFAKIKPFVQKKRGNKIEYPELYTNRLWDFTYNYVMGLNELAKNIVEHSSYKMGCITIRVYDSNDSSDIDFQHENIDLYLETHLFDFGERGILPTLLSRTEALSKQDPQLKEILSEDLERLSQDFKLRDFVKFGTGLPLAQQCYRHIAHYGLIMFYNLIESNNGLIMCQSIDKKNGMDGYKNKPYNNVLSNRPHISCGTSYFFTMPFSALASEEKIDLPKQKKILQGTSDSVLSIMNFLNFYNSENEYKIHDIKILDIVDRINDREHEKLLCDIIDRELISGEYDYVTIDFDKMPLSSSSLLRILSYISMQKKQQNIIVYNISSQLYRQLVNNNKLYYGYFELNNIPYWHNEEGILIYNYIEFNDKENNDREKINRFYFADILCGTNEEEFSDINWIIHNTYPNSNTIMTDYKPQTGCTIPNYLRPFFFKNVLMPFDLILDTHYQDVRHAQMSIFLCNLKLIVNQEIKPNKL